MKKLLNSPMDWKDLLVERMSRVWLLDREKKLNEINCVVSKQLESILFAYSLWVAVVSPMIRHWRSVKEKVLEVGVN